MDRTTQRFQKIATTLADLNAEGLNVQTVTDLLTMYVGAASQYVLRMSFVSEQEAQNFDRQVMTFWSRLMHRDIASPLFFYPSSLADLEWALQFNVTRPPMARVAVVRHTRTQACLAFAVGSTGPSPRGGILFVLCSSW